MHLEDRTDRHIRPSPVGHPDEVLDRAVRRGVITPREADLIGRTRLEKEGLAELARRTGSGYLTCRTRRTEADERLAAYLLISGPDQMPRGPEAAAGTGLAA
ncbi:hypothetical protein ABZ837_00180 [Streptomyces sp. NPDC047197]|uniref:hypothetical protein n=1 Tax=Streptomyces sp. NPDC047197 TaxID=3155477 RepID=UPI0033CEF81E